MNEPKRQPPTMNLTVVPRDKSSRNLTVISIWEGRSWTIDKNVTEEIWLQIFRDTRAAKEQRILFFNAYDNTGKRNKENGHEDQNEPWIAQKK